MIKHRPHALGQLKGEVGALAGVIEDAVDRHLREGNRLDALAAHFVFGDRLVAELLERERLERLARSVRINQVAGDHRVEPLRVLHVDAVAAEHDQIGLQVVADLFDRRIGEQRREQRQRVGRRHREAAAEALVPERDVARLRASPSTPRCRPAWRAPAPCRR